MAVISIYSTKGGVAKSMTAVHLSSYLAHQGESVFLLDADQNVRTSTDWLAQSTDKNFEGDEVDVFDAELVDLIEALKNDFDHVVIDNKGSNDVLVSEALMMSDFVISPIVPQQNDINSLPRTLETITNANSVNENLKYKFLVQKADTHAFSKKNKKLLQVLEDLELDRFDTIIKRRSGFDVAMEENSTVLDLENDKKAMFEINKFGKEFMEWINGKAV